MLGQDLFFRGSVWIADSQADQKPVELAFRQRISSLELVGILSGQNQERRSQRSCLTIHRHLVVVHRFQKGALSARSRSIDLIGDHDLSKERTRLKNKLPCTLIEDARADQVAGQQIGRELNAAESAIQA